MGKVIKMRKMFFLILTAMTLLTTSCGKKTDVDFGKGKYKEPFRGVLSSRPKWLETTLNWPVLRCMKPDTVTLTKNVKIKFYKSAVKSGSYATLRFTDKNNKLPQHVTIYCDGKPVKDGVCKIKATSRKKHVKIKFKIDPRIGNASVSGNIYNPGGEVKKINGHRTPKNSKYAAATWTFRHKIGRPFALWSVWYSIFIVIVVAVAIVLIMMTIRVLKMPSEIIEHKLRKNTLPIKGGHLFMNKGVSKEVKKELAVLNEIKNRHFDSEEQRMMAISDQHLKMFYKFVIPSRASKDVQKTMTKLLAESGNCTDMTCLKMPNLVCKFKANPADAETVFKSTLAIYEMNLEKSKKILKKWETDFFDFDKNHKQAENLAMIVKNIDGQCIKPAHSFTQNLIDQLDNLRSIAFCNIRLGVELANLIRPQTFTNEGKQTLARCSRKENSHSTVTTTL